MPHTVLLADDSVTIQRVIELTFADEDIRVVAVGDGDQAIAELMRFRPDIVLADAVLPGKSGYEVAEFMRRTPGLAEVPVLLLAGAFDAVDQQRADAAGCAGVLVKPFEPQQIIARVQELLTRPAGASADPAPAAPRQEQARPKESRASSTSVDEYFDRLDRAFGGTGGTSPDEAQAAKEDLMAWFASRKPGEAAPREGSIGVDTSIPPLAAAFLALLDAERDAGPAALPVPEPSDALVDAVASRVLSGLDVQAVRAAVSDVVSGIAERLVREEIDRIKAAVTGEEQEEGAAPSQDA